MQFGATLRGDSSFIQVKQEYMKKLKDHSSSVKERPNPRIGFKSLQYITMENCGAITITLLKKTREEVLVGIRTVDGTAKAIDDYISVDDIVKVSYLEYKFDVKIVYDEGLEPDEDFYIELYDPITKKRLIGEDTQTTVTIIDDVK